MVSSQLRALDTVLSRAQEEERRLLQEKLDQMALELERSRMAAEDARGQTFWFSGDRPVSWRDYALQREQMITQLTTEVIEPALDLVEEAAAHFRGGQVNLTYNTLQDVRRVLAQEEEEEEDSDDDDAAEDEEESE
jgi:hypothetical protein